MVGGLRTIHGQKLIHESLTQPLDPSGRHSGEGLIIMGGLAVEVSNLFFLRSLDPLGPKLLHLRRAIDRW